MEQSLCSITVDGDVFFISTLIRRRDESTHFDITLIDSGTMDAWKGTFGGDLESKAEALEMDETDFIDQTRKALTRQKLGDFSFEYQVKSTSQGRKELSWKKVVSSIKFQLGTVLLLPCESPPDIMKNILLHSIQRVSDLNSAIYRLETENDRLSGERTQALKRLENCVVMKEQMEGDLYGKFAAILNEKKAKIRELKSRAPASVDEDGDEGDEGQRSLGSTDDVIKHESEGEEAMDIDSGDDLDTDEEKERDTTSNKRQKKAAKPSTRTDQNDSIEFEEETPEAHTSKARRRRREPQVKKTPSSQKPAIPRGTSAGTPSTSRTPSTTTTAPSMRKTPSRTRSQKWTESDDVDGLLDDM